MRKLVFPQPTEFLQLYVHAWAWFQPGRGKHVPCKDFIRGLEKYAVQRYNSTVVPLAFISTRVQFIRKKFVNTGSL